jgi:hypothetical protein
MIGHGFNCFITGYNRRLLNITLNVGAFIKLREFLDQMSHYQLVKKDSVLRNYLVL